jgi:hypothetical protein
MTEWLVTCWLIIVTKIFAVWQTTIYIVSCRTGENGKFCIWQTHWCQMSNTFSVFYNKKSYFTKFCIFKYLQMYFWGGYAMRLCRCISWEGEWDTGVGRSSFIMQTVGSLLRTHWLAKPAQTIWQRVNSVNSLQWKMHTTTFDWAHLAKSKIWQTVLLLTTIPTTWYLIYSVSVLGQSMTAVVLVAAVV